jgi:hypothetical protein
LLIEAKINGCHQLVLLIVVINGPKKEVFCKAKHFFHKHKTARFPVQYLHFKLAYNTG